MHFVKKLSAVILVLALTLSLCSCSLFVKQGDISGTDVSGSESGELTPAQNEDSKLLSDLDYMMFSDSVGESLFSYLLTIKDPEKFPDIQKPESPWGSLQTDDSVLEGYLTSLGKINRENLSEDEKLTYDTLKQYLDNSVAYEGYDYYYEPLSALNGLHTMLPLNMAFVTVENKEDVEDYLALLEGIPQLVGEIVTFEEEKSAKGLFMRNASCDEVVSQLEDFIASGDDCFLCGIFDDLLAGVEGLTEEDKAAYQQRNTDGIKATFTAYGTLRDKLKELRPTGVEALGLAGLGEEGKKYFEIGLLDAACDVTTPDEAMELLSDEVEREVDKLLTAMQTGTAAAAQWGQINLTLGSAEEDLAYLKELVKPYFPELSEHVCEFKEIPEELKDQLSAAAYLIPPVDDSYDNLIIINSDMLKSNMDSLSTIAHEGYPGHMFQYVYQRALTTTGYMRKTLSLTAYYEAWSTTAEDIFAMKTERFNKNYCKMMLYNSRVTNVLIPAMISIGIHYKGWGEEEVKTLISQYFNADAADQMTQNYLSFVTYDPFYFLEYALGYSKLAEIKRNAEKEIGTLDFDLLEFNTEYLNLGPSYFNLVEEKIDKWVAGKTAE